MNTLKVTYINYKKKPEQAAGFPPFTRGYVSHNFETTILKKENSIADFNFNDSTKQSIIDCFNFIDINKEKFTTKGIIKLIIPFASTVKDVAFIRALRTLLSFKCKELYNNASALQFNFTTYHKKSESLTILYQWGLSAQVNTIVIDYDSEMILNPKKLLQYSPIDNLYGSKAIEKSTELLLLEVLPQITSIQL